MVTALVASTLESATLQLSAGYQPCVRSDGLSSGRPIEGRSEQRRPSPLKSMMHIAIPPYLHKINEFLSSCFIKISNYPKFSFNLRFFCLIEGFLLPPYF